MAKANSESSSKKASNLQPFMVLILAILLFFGCQFISLSVVQLFSNVVESKNLRIFVLSLCSVLTLLLLLKFAKNISLKKIVGLEKLEWNKLWIIGPVFIGYLCVSMLITVVTALLFSGFDINQVQDVGFSKSLSGVELIAPFLSLVIFTPIFEELIFRGVLFQGLRRNQSFWVSAAVTSLLFAVLHGQVNVALDTFALSMALCWLVERSGSLVPAVILHALKNSIAFMLLFVVKIG